MTMETPSVMPLKKSATTEIQKTDESPNTIIEIPKPNTATSNFIPALRLIGIYAVVNIVRKAPTAGAALKTPKPSGPTFKISCAKTGKRATAPPKSTAIMSKLRAPKMAFVLNTKRTPSFKL